jgi:hypothetical protein
MFLFAIPTLSNPRKATIDVPAIDFLRDNLGLQRFYTLGPIEPNYGAYFGIASINHNYLPVSKRWVEWVRAHLDSAADAVVWNGNYLRGPGEPKQADELRRNLAEYQWVGVKYVVAPAGFDPLPGTAKKVYADELIGIFELPAPKPYFETLAGQCTLEAVERTSATANCEGPAVLLRRELFFPGWRASVNGNETRIVEHRDLFQAIDLPAGKSEIRFRYAPPHVAWSWLAALAALMVLLFPGRRR